MIQAKFLERNHSNSLSLRFQQIWEELWVLFPSHFAINKTNAPWANPLLGQNHNGFACLFRSTDNASYFLKVLSNVAQFRMDTCPRYCVGQKSVSSGILVANLSLN
jgi:hypothetical protein